MMTTNLSATQPTATPPTADDRATEFTATDGNTGEQFSGYKLMVEAYAAIWLVMMAWIFFLWRKQADLGTRVQGLEDAIDRAEKKLVSQTKKTKATEEPRVSSETAT